MTQLSIRRATIQDAEAISWLISTVARQFILPGFSEKGRRKFLSDHAPEIMGRRLDGDFEYFLAALRGTTVGVAGVRGGRHLFSLFVSEQGCGIGRALWQHCLGECNWAPDAVEVTVNASINAVEAYRRLGFEPTAQERVVDGMRFVPMKCLRIPNSRMEHKRDT